MAAYFSASFFSSSVLDGSPLKLWRALLLAVLIALSYTANCAQAEDVSRDFLQSYYDGSNPYQKLIDNLGPSGSTPITGTNTMKSFPVNGTVPADEYSQSGPGTALSVPTKTSFLPNLSFLSLPVTYTFKPGPIGYQATSHYGPPTGADFPFQFDPGGLPKIDGLLPQNVVIANQKDLLFKAVDRSLRVTDTASRITLGDFQNDFVQRATDPNRWNYATQSGMQATQQMTSEATGSAGDQAMSTNLSELQRPLINVANEASAGSGELGKVVGQLQKIFKALSIPMAVLLLLPGAVLTNLKSMIQTGFSLAQDEDSVSPFPGILRAIVAVFLIPATQVIISYSIDTGNLMTDVVQKQTNMQNVLNWAKDQMARTAGTSSCGGGLSGAVGSLGGIGGGLGGIIGGLGGMGGGGNLGTAAQLAAGSNPYVLGAQALIERAKKRAVSDQTAGMATNSLYMLLSVGMTVMLGFQFVLMCYLYLLGPVAAALYAWPGGIRALFKPVFVNWLNAVINLSLWRFFWSVLILVMDTRLQWLQETGGYQPGSPWEIATAVSFVALMTAVPFMAFQFRPGDFVDNIVSKAGAQNHGANAAPGSGGMGNSTGANQQAIGVGGLASGAGV
ncbi:hypothetical protein BH10CYA1_BH10CYA1_64580 [soil metagenome]